MIELNWVNLAAGVVGAVLGGTVFLVARGPFWRKIRKQGPDDMKIEVRAFDAGWLTRIYIPTEIDRRGTLKAWVWHNVTMGLGTPHPTKELAIRAGRHKLIEIKKGVEYKLALTDPGLAWERIPLAVQLGEVVPPLDQCPIHGPICPNDETDESSGADVHH